MSDIMTDITDAEAAEVLWASSEQGKAAHKAAWRLLHEMGLHKHVDATQLGQIVYAAYLAAGWDAGPVEDEPEPAHSHSWAILGVQHIGKTLDVLFNLSPAQTIMLLRCAGCGDVATRTLPGRWTLEDLQATGEQQR